MIPEQAALLRKARYSLRGARLMADDGLYDFAVSRAYYTMFYVAEAFLLGKELAFSKHSAVISAFGQEFIKTGIIPPKFHSYLIEGQDRRNIGDYDVAPGITETQAGEQIDKAEEFLELAEELIGDISGEGD